MKPTPAMRKAFRALLDQEVEYNGNVYLDCGPDEVIELTGEWDEGQLSMTPNFPAFVALDRFGANRQLLLGHAGRLVLADELAGFAAEWKKLRAKPSLVSSAFEMVDRGFNDKSDIETAVRSIDDALATALKQRHDLALLSLSA
jgi:hypothetical protein